ncbi:MAG: hypothetical protein WCZ23_00815 [Rhodospirillaceae bacterium]
MTKKHFWSAELLQNGAHKGYDVAAFIKELRGRKITPHIARSDHVTKTRMLRRPA